MEVAMSAPFGRMELIDPGYYAREGYPHEIWRRLRREEPVHWFDCSPGEQFWALTRHEDIVAISRQPELFISGPTLSVHPTPLSERPHIPKNLIQFDPPEHGPQRRLISKHFTPRALRRFHSRIEGIARGVVDELFERGDEGECDFVEQISAPLPIAVIGWLLGVPEADWPKLFDWTNRQVGSADAEYQDDGATRAETMERAVGESFDYFTHLVARRRREPQDDLISLFAHAEVEGKHLTDSEVLVWCNLIVVAGNETTRNATTGGMLALIEHPDALRRLQSEPEWLRTAIEEILRWTTPVIHFARTATRDTEIRGQRIREGEIVVMFYGSANRDEEVFDAPFEFRIDRGPNRHLAFGVGEHFCAGAHVARLELEYAFQFLLPRLETIELAGRPERLRSAVIGGYKRLPIRYKLRAQP
jgi:cytochrome P450